MAPIPAESRRSTGRELREARRQLLHRGSVPDELLRPQLARSWSRSWQAGLQPCGRSPGAPHASGAQLARALDEQRELVAHAQPVMQFLAEQTQDSDSIVVLASADGLLLEALGDLRFATRAERVALRPGAVWREQYRGTNAIGTALAEGEPVVVHAGEHYLERNAFLTCAAAPIFGSTGALLGVLDVSGDQRGFHRHTLALVRSAARMIEHRLFDTWHDASRFHGLRLRLHRSAEGLGTLTEAMLALDGSGAVVGANPAALSLLGLRWADVGRARVDDIFADPLERLLHWGVQSPGTARVVHTHSGEALWLRVEGARAAVLPRGVSPTIVPGAPPADALAALDTGDARLHSAIARARKLLGKPIPVLLQGESGAGKEVFARAMHASGPRRDKAFVAVNCAALPETLIEAELFGYERGAFTGALREGAPGRIREAHGGTLLLDEIGDMPLALQARLLRVLQDGEVVPLGGGKPVPVDFALVCATHRDLPAEISAGRFREDLFYRLNGFALRLPALRERSDCAELVARELRRLAPHSEVSLVPDLLAAMLAHPWPGNLRQLANTLRTACALLETHEQVIGWEHLADDMARALRQEPAAPASDMRSITLAAAERTLTECAGNHSEAARRLGIGRNTLYRKLTGR